MIHTCAQGAGNLLLHIGPAQDGSVPSETIGPLTAVGKWLSENCDAAYGKRPPLPRIASNRLCGFSCKDNTLHVWKWIWPGDRELALSDFAQKLKRAYVLASSEELAFTQEEYRVILRDLTPRSPRTLTPVLRCWRWNLSLRPTISSASQRHPR